MPSPTSYSPSSRTYNSGAIGIDALLSGTKWGGSVGTGVNLTYSFPGENGGIGYYSTNLQDYGSGKEFNQWTRLSTSQIALAENALHAWSNVANINFRKVSDTQSNVGDIRIAFTWSNLTPGEAAHAYHPADAAIAGDIWLNANVTANYSPSIGTYGYLTLLHEIGHAIGLKHPFETGPNGVLLPISLDNRTNTVMSYTDNALMSGFGVPYPTTPMPLDIASAQYLYGANYSYRNGNDTYSYSGSQYHETIWDGGGSDRIVYTGFDSCTINLEPGSASVFGSSGSAKPSVYIAYNCIIEGATGANGNDLLIANSNGCTLVGNSGNDTLRGGRGGDWLQGGTGNDEFTGGAGSDVLDGGDGLDTAMFFSSSGGVIVRLDASLSIDSDGQVDRLVSIESAVLSSFGDIGVGDAAANVLLGLGGDDELIGNAGADILQGGDGNDVLVGGADADQIDGGSGMDLVSYSTSTAPVTVYLSQGTASGGDAQGDKLISVESAMGSDFNDTLYGGADGNVLVGLLGNDVLFGGGGDDIIRGDKGDDLLYGEAGSDWLEGGDGNDDFFGDAGGDWLDGGNGIDYVSYGMSDAAVTVRLDVGVALGGYAQGDRLVSIEEVLGSSYNDTLVADARGNTLYGMFGDDLLIGGAGADLMIGEIGNDVFNGGASGDYIRGGAGQDVLSYIGSSAGVIARLDNGVFAGGDASDDNVLEIESLIGSANSDILIGDGQGNVLLGGDGFDLLNGGGGSDIVNGGSGNDELWGGAAADIFVFSWGIDTVKDFQLGVDHIDLREMGAQPGQISVTAALGGTLLTYGTNQMFLQGISQSAIGNTNLWV